MKGFGSRLLRFPLRTRFVLVLVGIQVLMLAVLIWNNARVVSHTHTQRLIHTARDTAELLAIAAAPRVVEEDYGRLTDLVQVLTRNEEVAYAVILDAQGRTMALSGNPLSKDSPQRLSEADLSRGRMGIYEVAAPLMLGGTEQGRVILGFSTATLYQAIREGRNQGIALALVSVVLTFAAALAAGHLLTRSLHRLAEASRHLASGDFTRRFPVTGQDEVAQLAQSLNTMADALQLRQEELASNYEELELSNEELRTAYEQLERSQAELEQKNAELRASEEKYRTLIESANDAIFVLEPTFGTVLECNDRASALTGYSKTEMRKMRLTDFCDSENRPAVEQHLREIREKEAGTLSALYLFSRTGERVPVEISSRLVAYGESKAILGIARDLTEKKRMEQQLLQAEKLSALGELVSGVAHELNNPLTGILGYSELLLQSPAPPDRETLARIHREAERMRRIVQNLLAFARRSKPEKIPTQVNDLLYQIMELMEYEMRVNNVRVITNLDTSIPCVLADPHQLQQVFLNLINNAYQAMLPGGGTLTLTTAHDPQTRRVRVGFTDTGVGIPPEYLGRIFDPFFTTKEVGQGTGLGLSLSYGIVKEHGGEIRVTSRVGEGSTFQVELPVPELPVAAPPAGARPEGPVSQAALRILVVDDEPIVLSYLSELLRSAGHRVDTAVDGRQALERIATGDYQLIISDIKMPGLSGRDLFHHLSRQRSPLVHRLLFITGDTFSEETQRFLEESGVPHLAKPFGREEILKAIQKVLGR